MPFVKGTPKPPGSGRIKGKPPAPKPPPKVLTITVSRGITLSNDVRARLEEIGCDPVAGLATMALDERVDAGIRRLCFADLMKYVYPQRRSVEFSGQINTVGVTIDGNSALRALEDRIAGIRERLAIAQSPDQPQ